MARSTRSDLLDLIASKFPTNGDNVITASDARDVLNELVASDFNLDDDNFADFATGLLAPFNPGQPYNVNDYFTFDDGTGNGNGEDLYRTKVASSAGQTPLTNPANFTKIGEVYIQTTRVNFIALGNASKIKQRKLYEITDAVNGSTRILVFSGSQPSSYTLLALNLTDYTVGHYLLNANTFTPFPTYVPIARAALQTLISNSTVAYPAEYEITDAVTNKHLVVKSKSTGAICKAATNLTDDQLGYYDITADTFSPILST